MAREWIRVLRDRCKTHAVTAADSKTKKAPRFARPFALSRRASANQIQCRSRRRRWCRVCWSRGRRWCCRSRGGGGCCRRCWRVVVITTRDHARKLLREVPVLLRTLHQLRGFLVVAVTVVVDHLLSAGFEAFGAACEFVSKAEQTLGVQLLALRTLAPLIAAAAIGVASLIRNLARITATRRLGRGRRGSCWCRGRAGSGGGGRGGGSSWCSWRRRSSLSRRWRRRGRNRGVRLHDGPHAACVQRIEKRGDLERWGLQRAESVDIHSDRIGCSG